MDESLHDLKHRFVDFRAENRRRDRIHAGKCSFCGTKPQYSDVAYYQETVQSDRHGLHRTSSLLDFQKRKWQLFQHDFEYSLHNRPFWFQKTSKFYEQNLRAEVKPNLINLNKLETWVGFILKQRRTNRLTLWFWHWVVKHVESWNLMLIKKKRIKN